MRHLSKTATKQFEKILAQMPAPEEGYHTHVKFNKSDIFMPVCVEVIEHVGTDNWGRVVSLAHYGEQNGDLMADPEVTFIEYTFPEHSEWYPMSHRMDYMGKDSQYIERDENGVPKRFSKAMQADLAVFCNMWMKNIINQQGL
jgi:hypothetical protein